MFTKPLSRLTTEDLQALLDEGAIENIRLEFKRLVPSKEELLKKISAFANTFGGFIIVGAAEEGSRGKLHTIAGVEPQSDYKQQVITHAFAGAYPPINVEVSDAIESPSDPSKVCYIIHVPISDLAPHFLNGRRGIYVRTDEHSQKFEPQLATQAELVALSDRRRAIVDKRQSLIERARARASRFLGPGSTPKVEIAIVPRFPSSQIDEGMGIYETVTETSIRFRNDQFPFDRHQLVTQHESAIVRNPSSEKSILELNVWGLIHFVELIEWDKSESEVLGIHLNCFLGHLLAVLRWSALVHDKYDLRTPIRITMSLSGIADVPWLHFPDRKAKAAGASPFGDEVELTLDVESGIRQQDVPGIVDELVKRLFFAMNWPGAAENIDDRRELFKFGCDYNFWRVPDDISQYPNCS